jgi:ATP-dependent DNA helicase RecG
LRWRLAKLGGFRFDAALVSSIRLFISSVQKEFAAERAALREHLRGDALMKRFFDVFLFEDFPAADRRADDLYLREVENCDLYIGLFGDEYGFIDKKGISPTEREFQLATKLGKQRLIYVKGVSDKTKHPKMQALIQNAGSELIRRRFTDTSGLLPAVYASLVTYLEEHKLILNGPFDAAACQGATLRDLNSGGMRAFVREARASRGFPLKETASIPSLLTHLNLLEDGKPKNAAILLFGGLTYG